MAANQTSVNSPPFSTIVQRIVARLIAGAADATANNTRIVVAPDAEAVGPDHLAKTGYLVRVSAPDPQYMTGAGRHGYISERRVDVIVVSSSLLDSGGRDDAAALAHITREESVLNVLILDPPADLSYGTPVARLIKFIPGGADMGRRLKTTPSVITSVLPFVVTYTPPLVVYRD